MSLFIDRKYIAILATRLPLFKKKKDDLYNFRCIFCKDSKRSKIKARGYFFVKKNDFFFKCFNCSESHTLANFLKSIDLNLYKKYILERFANGDNGKTNYKKPLAKDIFPDSKPTFAQKTINLLSIEELPQKHFCREYVQNIRKIPQEHLKNLYFTNDFQGFVDEMVKGKYKNLGHTQKLIIPFFNSDKKLFAFQARSLTTNDRYITIRLNDEDPKVFGLDRVDADETIYVLEGPLDSLFLPNAIAAAGSDLPLTINPTRCVFIFDNENRNPQIINKMNHIIHKGYKIVVWPKMCKKWGKDINEIVQTQFCGPEEIKRIIDKSTFQGLEAELEFARWSK